MTCPRMFFLRNVILLLKAYRTEGKGTPGSVSMHKRLLLPPSGSIGVGTGGGAGGPGP